MKLYVAEAGSARVVAIAEEEEGHSLVSHLVETELWCALMAKELARSVPRGFAQAALGRYRQSLSDGIYVGVAVSARVQEAAEMAVQRCARGRAGFALRAIDALHLGTALAGKCDGIVTTDGRLGRGATVLGLKTLPE